MFLIISSGEGNPPTIRTTSDADEALKVFGDECLTLGKYVESITLYDLDKMTAPDRGLMRYCAIADSELCLIVSRNPMVILDRYNATNDEVRDFVTQ